MAYTQVSGSIALDLGRVVQDTAYVVVHELTRMTRTAEEQGQGVEPPLMMIADAVTARVMLRLNADLGGVLAEVRTALFEIKQMIADQDSRQQRVGDPL